MEVSIEQKSKICKQGIRYHINIRKKFHQKIIDKKLLGRDLKVTITFNDVLD